MIMKDAVLHAAPHQFKITTFLQIRAKKTDRMPHHIIDIDKHARCNGI
jgi:hypothetical protein